MTTTVLTAPEDCDIDCAFLVGLIAVQTSLQQRAEVKMLGRQKANQHGSSTYSVAADFCRIFEKDMNRLYLLSFLLTGNHATAEECFVRGLEDATRSNRVFKEWAQGWARRVIIQNAIQMVQPQATPGSAGRQDSDYNASRAATEPARIAAIVELPAFDRFAFVMSTLEGYSDQDCSLLLGSTRVEVVAARVRALQRIAESSDLQRQLSIATGSRSRAEHRLEVGQGAALQLAASA